MAPMPQAIRVMIADDHTVVRLGLRVLISNEPDMVLVGEAANGTSAVTQARALRPDVLVLGLRMPDLPGVQVIQELAARAPEVRVLVLTMFDDDDHVLAALRAGAHGYLLKDMELNEVIQGVRDVADDKPALHPAIAARVLQQLARPSSAPAPVVLTQREQQVLSLVAQGLANKTIGGHLSLSERTVRSYVSAILAKLHVSSRTQATLHALRTGLVRPEAAPP